MIRALLVDDEPPARTRLRQLLVEAGDVLVVGEAANVDEARSAIAETHPDVVFLDIEMPEGRGTTLAASLPEPRPFVVFATAFDRYALDAFAVDATDYLLKPITRGTSRGYARARARALVAVAAISSARWWRPPPRRRSCCRARCRSCRGFDCCRRDRAGARGRRRFLSRAAARPADASPGARRRLRQRHVRRSRRVERAGADRNVLRATARAPRPTSCATSTGRCRGTIGKRAIRDAGVHGGRPGHRRGPDCQRRPPAADCDDARANARAAELQRTRHRHASRGALRRAHPDARARRGARGLQRRRDRGHSTRTARSSARRTWSRPSIGISALSAAGHLPRPAGARARSPRRRPGAPTM